MADDGRGFPLERLAERLANGHVGLASQRVRIEAAGGRLDADLGGRTRHPRRDPPAGRTGRQTALTAAERRSAGSSHRA